MLESHYVNILDFMNCTFLLILFYFSVALPMAWDAAANDGQEPNALWSRVLQPTVEGSSTRFDMLN